MRFPRTCLVFRLIVLLTGLAGLTIPQTASGAVAPRRSRLPKETRIAPASAPVPLVVAAPTIPVDVPDIPIDGNPEPSATPEPTSLLTAMIGSGIALAGWRRSRRSPTAGEDMPIQAV